MSTAPRSPRAGIVWPDRLVSGASCQRVVSAGRVGRISRVEIAGAGESPQHPSGYPLLHRGEVFRAQRGGLGDVELPVLAGGGHSVNHAAVEVDSRALS